MADQSSPPQPIGATEADPERATPKSPAPKPPYTSKVLHGKLEMTDAGIAMVELLAAGGHPRVGIAGHLNISRQSLRAIEKRDPRVAEAVSRGLAIDETELVSLLKKSARKGNVVAAIFLLKGRHGWREGQPREGDVSVLNNIVIALPGAQSAASWKPPNWNSSGGLEPGAPTSKLVEATPTTPTAATPETTPETTTASTEATPTPPSTEPPPTPVATPPPAGSEGRSSSLSPGAEIWTVINRPPAQEPEPEPGPSRAEVQLASAYGDNNSDSDK